MYPEVARAVPHPGHFRPQPVLGQMLDAHYGPSFPLAMVDTAIGVGIAYVGIRTGLSGTGMNEAVGWVAGVFGIYYGISSLSRAFDLVSR